MRTAPSQSRAQTLFNTLSHASLCKALYKHGAAQELAGVGSEPARNRGIGRSRPEAGQSRHGIDHGSLLRRPNTARDQRRIGQLGPRDGPVLAQSRPFVGPETSRSRPKLGRSRSGAGRNRLVAGPRIGPESTRSWSGISPNQPSSACRRPGVGQNLSWFAPEVVEGGQESTPNRSGVGQDSANSGPESGRSRGNRRPSN